MPVTPPTTTAIPALRRWQLYTYYCAVAIGVTAIRFDFVQGRTRRSPLIQIYGCTINVLVLTIMPLTFAHYLEFLDYVNKNRLMRIVNAVNIAQTMLLAALTIIFRWQRECAIIEMLAQMLDLERAYFDGCVPATVKQQCAQMYGKQLLWTKYFSVVIQTVTAIYMLVFTAPSFNLRTLLYSAHVICLNSVLLHTILHYFLAMWYVWERFCWLNAQLQRIFNLLQLLAREKYCAGSLRRRMQRRLAEELLQVARIHRRLTVLTERFNECYRLQILTVLISKIINNISVCYLSLKYRDISYFHHFGAFGNTLSFLGFLFVISDSFLLDTLCERVIGAARDTAQVLKLFEELTELDASVECACDLLAQQLRQHQLSISILGMIDLNKRLSFLVIGGLVKNVLLLLQWDLGRQFDEK